MKSCDLRGSAEVQVTQGLTNAIQPWEIEAAVMASCCSGAFSSFYLALQPPECDVIAQEEKGNLIWQPY
jgi:hypothetical protein